MIMDHWPLAPRGASGGLQAELMELQRRIGFRVARKPQPMHNMLAHGGEGRSLPSYEMHRSAPLRFGLTSEGYVDAEKCAEVRLYGGGFGLTSSICNKNPAN